MDGKGRMKEGTRHKAQGTRKVQVPSIKYQERKEKAQEIIFLCLLSRILNLEP